MVQSASPRSNGGRQFGEMSVFIIAEAGVNHNGSIDVAKKLIDEASNAGADAVKFQLFKADVLYPKKKDKIKDKDNEESDDIVEVKKREPVPHAMQDIEYWKRKYVIIKNLFY
jgi:sialic acid synthase SpsE